MRNECVCIAKQKKKKMHCNEYDFRLYSFLFSHFIYIFVEC